MIENWTDLFRFSKTIRQESNGAKYGYMKSLMMVTLLQVISFLMVAMYLVVRMERIQQMSDFLKMRAIEGQRSFDS